MTSVHVFFEKTGSMLDFGFLVARYRPSRKIRKVVGSETNLLHYLVVPTAIVYGTVGPAVVTRLITHGWHLPTRSAGRISTAPPAACLAALFFISPVATQRDGCG